MDLENYIKKKQGYINNHYDRLLLREVKQTYVSVVVFPAEFIEESIRSLPDELKEQIKSNPKYSGLFVEWRVK